MTQPVKFNKHDETTWPDKDAFVLWAYRNHKGEIDYAVANMDTSFNIRNERFFSFEPAAVEGYEWESQLTENNAIAWQPVCRFLEESND